MDGSINHQGSSYRKGLVLGLTMAEIMVLLVFCLLIAMATFLKSEQTELANANARLEDLRRQSERDRAAIATLSNEAGLAEKLTSLAGADPAKINEYWRDLVDAKAALSDLKNEGTSLAELRDGASQMAVLRKAGIDPNTALRDADIVAAMKRVLPDGSKTALTPQSVAEMLTRAAATPAPSFAGPGGHQWPPIISLSEANGYTFKTGSAELSREFSEALLRTTADEILAKIQQYDVDVIEVVGHTDEQTFGGRIVAAAPIMDAPVPLAPTPIAQRQSNLDRGLTSILKSGGDIARLTPVDNAGLGLARAVSVVSVLRTSPKLRNYKMIPLSGGQLINTDETLALNASSAGDVAQRRRIEIRLRKSAPHESSAAIASPPSPPTPRRAISKPATPRPIPSSTPAPPRPPSLFSTFGH